ncbi:hypothetical protein BGZ83_006089 [Gryganskiella cystojenkinii]|nr:hypothetical protein BGZ83_006089 [Gryganskiella cystojenkinii]
MSMSSMPSLSHSENSTQSQNMNFESRINPRNNPNANNPLEQQRHYQLQLEQMQQQQQSLEDDSPFHRQQDQQQHQQQRLSHPAHAPSAAPQQPLQGQQPYHQQTLRQQQQPQQQQRYFQGQPIAHPTSASSAPSSPAWPANSYGGTPDTEMPSLDYGNSTAAGYFPPHLQQQQNEYTKSPRMVPLSPSPSISPPSGDCPEGSLSDDFFVASVLNMIPTNIPPVAHFDYLSEFSQRQRIATGGNGEIRRAFWQLHQTYVILKSLIDTKHKPEKIIKLFDKEVEVMSQCKQHDNIVQFYGIAIRNSEDERKGDRFMIMQYYEHGDLTKLLEKPKDLLEAPTLTDKLYLAMDIAVGLDHLLKCGYHHGDLHPKNILIDLRPNPQPNQGRYRARLTDFGLRRIRDNKNQVSSQQFGGVWQFMAPERMSKNRPRYDIRCDIFALGVLYWFILAGRYPFKDPSTFSPGMRESRIDGTPEWYYQIYTKAWSEDPNDRQQTLEEIVQAFRYNLGIASPSSQRMDPSHPYSYPTPAYGYESSNFPHYPTIDTRGFSSAASSGAPSTMMRASPLMTPASMLTPTSLNSRASSHPPSPSMHQAGLASVVNQRPGYQLHQQHHQHPSWYQQQQQQQGAQ